MKQTIWAGPPAPLEPSLLSAKIIMREWKGSFAMGMFDALVNQTFEYFRSVRDRKEQELHLFVLDAMGSTSCVAEPSNQERLSFSTVEWRIRNLQEQDPARARECGVPAVQDSHRGKSITRILNDMRRKGLVRYHFPNNWERLVR